VNARGSLVESSEVREERRSEQYSLAKILGIWALAAAPMGIQRVVGTLPSGEPSGHALDAARMAGQRRGGWFATTGTGPDARPPVDGGVRRI
jgi:hypothetical protein